jgi:hypothetical protein
LRKRRWHGSEGREENEKRRRRLVLVGVKLQGDSASDWPAMASLDRGIVPGSIFKRLSCALPLPHSNLQPSNPLLPPSHSSRRGRCPGRVGSARRLGLPNLTAVGTATFHSALQEEEPGPR